jgi:hypothetical protein
VAPARQPCYPRYSTDDPRSRYGKFLRRPPSYRGLIFAGTLIQSSSGLLVIETSGSCIDVNSWCYHVCLFPSIEDVRDMIDNINIREAKWRLEIIRHYDPVNA